MNKIQGAIEGIHYHVINGRAFPIVRGGDGPLSPSRKPSATPGTSPTACARSTRRPPPAVPLSPTPPSAAATALTDDEQARWDAGEAERLRLVSVIERLTPSPAAQVPAAVAMGDGALRQALA